ncbi:MAG TPA: ABC transporter permease [Gemmatimonadales bacterium]|nr:ABC transporter permease [Gemmatimonadales bacterium]
MLFGEVFRVALEALRANRLRSLLTMLGIVIGVGAVITMVALGSGARRAVQDRIQALGPTLLNVFSGQDFRGGVAVSTPVRLTYDDALALARDARYVAGVAPELERGLQIEYGDRNINEDVIGTTPNFVVVHNYPLTAGRFFTEGDNAARRRYAVLGATIPTQLQANGSAMIGQDIRIAGIPFTVLGVLAEKGGGPGSNDNDVLIPFETARYRVMGTDRLRTIAVKASDVASMPIAMIEIERVLRREHKIAPGAENDFRIRNQRDVLSTFEQTTQTFGYLLAGVAAVSLLVGGIGIMNIMLVSVTERTREIGVRKALGATRRNILVQFVVEAVVLCLVGGLMGIVLGSLGAVLLSRLAHWNTLISPAAIFMAFCFSAAVGLFFGIWPARRAATLDPIEALRYE